MASKGSRGKACVDILKILEPFDPTARESILNALDVLIQIGVTYGTSPLGQAETRATELPTVG